MTSLPPEVHALAENAPLEDFLLALLRERLPEPIRVQSLVEMDQRFPLVLVRRIPGMGDGKGDPRFLDSSVAAVHVFVEGVEGDSDAAVLSEAIRVILRDAWLNHKVVPGVGHLTHFEVAQVARRTTDWSTSMGPVQYADLPAGVVRYEAHYALTLRRPTRR